MRVFSGARRYHLKEISFVGTFVGLNSSSIGDKYEY